MILRLLAIVIFLVAIWGVIQYMARWCRRGGFWNLKLRRACHEIGIARQREFEQRIQTINDRYKEGFQPIDSPSESKPKLILIQGGK